MLTAVNAKLHNMTAENTQLVLGGFAVPVCNGCMCCYADTGG